jgi:RNA polymerase sigma factor (sigma-70 family)
MDTRFEALNRLPLERIHRRVVSEVRTKVRIKADAEDFVQEAWLRVLESIPEDGSLPELLVAPCASAGMDPEDDTLEGRVVRALVRSARSIGFNAYRARCRQKELLRQYRRERPAPPDLRKELDRKEEQERVRKILQGLSPTRQQLLRMSANGFSYAEIAEAIGAKPESVGRRLTLARAAFEVSRRGIEGEQRGGTRAA